MEYLGWGLAGCLYGELANYGSYSLAVFGTLLFTYILVKLRELLRTSFRQKLELHHATNSGDGHTQTQI